MGTISIPAEFLETIKRQAEMDYPNETCGILTGPSARPEVISGIFPCRNKQDEYHAHDPENFPRPARTAYFIDPQDLLRLQRESRGKGEEMRVIYHSHTDAGAYFSEEDTRIALAEGEPAWPGVSYVVVSVIQGKAGEALLFQWDTGQKAFFGSKI